MKKLNNNKKDGITLISLVVTIVVLLILAGVSISTLVGENGVVDNAKKIQNDTYYQIASEEVKQLVLEHKLRKEYETLEEFLVSKVPTRIDGVTRKDDNTLIVKKNGYEIEVESENKIIIFDATPYVGTYDGQPHDMITSVNVSPSDAKVEYSIDNGKTYIENIPQIINASSVSVIVKASRIGYKTEKVTKTAVVNKAEGKLTLSETSGTIEYLNSATFTVSANTGTLSAISSNTSVATVSISGSTVTVKSVGVGSATITVTSAEASNYTAKKATYTVTVKPQTVSPTQSGVGYYADVDNDGTIDGVIFEDFRIGGSGSWGGRSYTVATVSDTKTYYVSKTNCKGPFGPKDVITSTGTGNNRFYIMALKDVDGKQNGTGYTWDNAKALGKNGWVLPSVNEWTAFASALKIDTSNYNGYGLSDNYWSSTAEGGRTAYYIRFNAGEISYMRSNAMGLFGTYNYTSGRVARTF